MSDAASRDDVPSIFTDPKTGRTVHKLTASDYHDIGTYYDRRAWNDQKDRIVFSAADPDSFTQMRRRDRVGAGRYTRGPGHSIGPLYTDAGAIYVMDADGSNKRLITENEHFNGHTGCTPEWIPGEETILYGGSDVAGNAQANLIDLETGEHITIPGLSPRMIDNDGTRLLCQVTEGILHEGTNRTDAVSILNLDTWDEEVILTVDELIDASMHDRSEFTDPVVANLKWSPDGSEFILRFSDQIGDRNIKELYVLNADGSNVRQITAAADSFHHHSWHPDGERLLYGDRNQNGEPRLYFTDTAEPDTRILVTDEPLGGHPSVSPDGSKIVTGSYSGGGITMIDAASGDTEQLTSTLMETFHYHAIWGPDGQRVIYNSDQDGTCNIYQVEIE